MARRIVIEPQRTLAEHAAQPDLAAAVHSLRSKAEPIVDLLRDRTVWMVNSTAQGGGVSEMLPGMVAHLNELGVRCAWAVIETAEPAFFAFTKRLHNLIHGSGEPSIGDAERELFEATNRSNAADLAGLVRDGDILVVHDPQPMPLARLLRDQLDIIAIWRCHIGLDERNAATRAAWRFLQPYAPAYAHAVFSAPEYVVSYFEARASIIYPSLDPLTEKNRPLDDVAAVLERARLRASAAPAADRFTAPALRLQDDGSFAPADLPTDFGLLTRPIVTQVSRWDRLKGFLPLLHGFALLKQRLHQEPPVDAAFRRRLEDVRLVLAGPDADSIADDPEGREVLAELCAAWQTLASDVRADIALITLPMTDLAANGLIVNALQRASTVVVQNSLREGFGLTITEAMWKGVPVLSNVRACGPRQQIRPGIDGAMIGDPEDTAAIARGIANVLADPARLGRWGASAHERVRDHFLIYSQLRHWLRLIGSLAGKGNQR